MNKSPKKPTFTSYFKNFCFGSLLFVTSFFVATSFFTHKAKAQTQIIDQQDWITRNQQNILEEKKREREFDAISKERERNKKEEDEKQSKKTESLISGKMPSCVEIKEINLLNAKSISNFRQQKIVSPFIGKCVEAEILASIIKAVNDYYQNQGFASTQVLVPKQNLQSGIFELQIIEGKIEKISFGKDRFVEKMQELTAFGIAKGNVLNLNDINQGMYQINRLQSNSAVMKIEPGSEIGESIVKIDNNKKFPAKFTVGKDNLGNKFTGIQRTNFSASLDNLLFLNDNLNLSYSTNLHDNNQIKDIKSFSGSLSIPLKHNTLTYDYSRSQFKGQNSGKNGAIISSGFSQSSKITLDRVLLSKTNLRISTTASLTDKSTASYSNGEKITTSQRSLSIANLGLTISSYLNDSTSIYFKPSWTKGLKIFNAKQDQKNVNNSTPKAQFEVFKLYASASKKFTLPKINAPIFLTSELDSQFSKQTLFGSEQTSVGGYYSVRGFRENYITGDNGYNFRNKISFSLGSILMPLFDQKNEDKSAEKNSENFFTKNIAKNTSRLNKIRLEPFYDYGFAQNKYDNSSGRMSGAGIKTIFDSKYFNASITYSQALQKSKLITSNIKENKMIYFEIGASCC